MSNTNEFDVVVVGSGASGLSAAITAKLKGLSVLLIEKGRTYGGTSARSGGWLWIPCTSLADQWGHEDSHQAVKDYIKHEAKEFYNEERVDAFLKHGAEAVDFFTQNTAVKFDMPLTFPDYHAEAPGAMQGGRSMVARHFDGRELGKDLKKLEPPLPELTVFGMMIGSGADIKHFMRATKSVESAIYATKRLGKHLWQAVTLGRGMTLTNGNALVGRLAKTFFDQKIPMWLESPVQDLLVENGKVVGAKIDKQGELVEVKARKGVILAAGGFPHNIERRKQHYKHAPTGTEHWSPTPTTNTGDTHAIVEKHGGAIDSNVAQPAAWTPMSRVKRPDGSEGVMPHFIDRAKPGVIAVLNDGKRFTNEGNSYHDYVQAMIESCKDKDEVCSWLIADHFTLRNYGLGCVPIKPLPIGKYLKSGYLIKAKSIKSLAEKCGINPAKLVETVESFNKYAAVGQDPEFGKGSKAYNRHQGDAFNAPNPCVKEINSGPFYAVKIVPGDIGTYVGISVDRNCQVKNSQGDVIDGLYAVGNDSVSIMGGNYPGAGITLGPALTFGYAVANYIANKK